MGQGGTTDASDELETVKEVTLTLNTLTPMASAASSSSRTAFIALP